MAEKKDLDSKRQLEGTSSTEQETPTTSTPNTGGLRRGKCKWFNINKGWGFITPDDGGQDVFVHQSVLQMTGFRSLGENEVVEFECKSSEKGVEATRVTGPEQTDIQGGRQQRNTKRRFRKTRCYNCGEFANHLAAECTLESQPKKCHYCKSAEHLVADCPVKKAEKDEKETGHNE